ncbi:MAG: pyrroline-5-carboxylate reductase [Chitinispirillaceae bacterium]|nr:pyrroline-5-carboxylate reductase [Chitinispirillaceae bacterium]
MHIAVLGTGTMGKAIIDGLLRSGKEVVISAYDALPQATSGLSAEIAVTPPGEWFSGDAIPDAVIFAVKPADIPAACAEVYTHQQSVKEHVPLWISIAAGITLQTLGGLSSPETHICRVMPNTPARVGEGLSAYACNAACTKADTILVETIFSACGRTVSVQEKLLHAVTGLSGSGPAYVFLFIEALIEGGVTAGLPLATARECAVQTVFGAAAMLRQTSEHTGALKAGVMSPGGTTAAGLHALERNAFKNAVIEAVAAATARSAQLGA